MNEQAFINGFLKRAADYGVSENEAISILKQATIPLNSEISAPKHYHLPLGEDDAITKGLNSVGDAAVGAGQAIGNTAHNIGNAIGNRFQNFKTNVGGMLNSAAHNTGLDLFGGPSLEQQLSQNAEHFKNTRVYDPNFRGGKISY
jgi:hypothetical protein